MNIKKTVDKLPVVISSIALSLLFACSGEEKKDSVKQYDHAHDGGTDMGKHRFEHAFAEQCIARETKNSVNKENDRKWFTEPCLCIANYLLRDLSAANAEKFINEKKHTRSLQIKYDNAAYQCLQQKQQPQAPKIFATE